MKSSKKKSAPRVVKGSAQAEPATGAITRDMAEEAVRTLLAWAGDDPKREGLRDTPRRVATAYRDWFSGYASDPAAYPAGIITLDRPMVMLPGDMHFVDVTIVAGTSFGGAQFYSQAGFVTDEWVSQGPWLNPGGTSPTSTCLILGWLINPLGLH